MTGPEHFRRAEELAAEAQKLLGQVSRRVDVTDRGGRGVQQLLASGDVAEDVRGLRLVRPGTHNLPPQDRNLMAQH